MQKEGLDRPAHQRDRLAAAADAELRQDVVDVLLDGWQLDRELEPDLLVRQACLEEAQDLLLARRQLIDGRPPGPQRPERGDAVQQRLGRLRRHRDLAVGDAPQRRHEVRQRLVARHEAGDAGLRARDEVRPVVPYADRYDAGAFGDADERPNLLLATRRRRVQEDEVGGRDREALDHIARVDARADDVEDLIVGQGLGERLPVDTNRAGHEDPDAGGQNGYTYH